MATRSTADDRILGTNEFYRRALHVLNDGRVPFLVGGSHAFLHYTGITRDTKDFDLFIRRSDLDAALAELAKAGYRSEITFAHWLGKAFYGEDAVDLVFSSGNGVATVDDDWFAHAVEGNVLGVPVKLAPPEELLWQKAFIMERERFDGADVVHLLHAMTERLDWERIVRRFDDKWEILLAHMVTFGFVYPDERARLPRDVMHALLSRAVDQLSHSTPTESMNGSTPRVCRGTLVSRAQYLVDIGQRGYADARLAPRGGMTGEQLAYWTWAIDHVK